MGVGHTQGRVHGGRRRFAGAVALTLIVASGIASNATAGAQDAGSTPAEPVVAQAAGPSNELLYVTEGNRLRRIDVDSIGRGSLVQDILVQRASQSPTGRDINGEICERPDSPGGFVAGEDTGQPNPPPGWGVFNADGTQVGKLTATYNVPQAEPFGCAFAPDGTLFTSEVGFQGFGNNNGQLIQWFPPYDQFPGPPGEYPNTNAISTNFCKLAVDLGTAGAVLADPQGRIYVAQASGLRIDRFSPPFPTAPTAAGGCGGVDATGAPIADTVQRDVLTPSAGTATFSGLALAPNGNIYASSVFTGQIGEYDTDGNFVRWILSPPDTTLPIPTGSPQGIAVGADGTLYYADLNLVGALPNVGPGPNGKVWRIRFNSDGDPLPPEIVREGLAFPDGVSVFSGDLESTTAPPLEWPTLAGGTARKFFNANESSLTAATAPNLIERWRFDTNAVVTSSPSVATIDHPTRGRIRAVFFSSWDKNFYALDWATGAELWRFAWEDQPGASFPAAGSVTITDIDGERIAFVAAGETMYALNAATGAERWRFAAGTGCGDAAAGTYPGICSFQGERNEVETTPIIADGLVYFGMDVNDVTRGKGGFYAVDASAGTLEWFFDPESGAVCRPDPTDEIRNYDGYHSEAELGLPAGFLSTRDGCDAPRNLYGCGNVWSSPSYDATRGLLYFGTSNCDTDNDPATPTPAPPMPPYDEAIVALNTDGTPAWRWRPREVDNADLAFGATPNLFTIDVDGQSRDVLGVGNKDGTYYVLDRDGVNVRNGVAWDDTDPQALPYWQTNVVPGGPAGGIIGTASVDESTRRVFFSTAPGFNPTTPQQPTVHALDLDTGAIAWQNTGATGREADASFGPVSGVPGVVMVGSVVLPRVRFYDATDGSLLSDRTVGAPGTLSGVASGAVVLDGTVIVGAGIGTRSSGGSSPGDFAANAPSAVVALCVPGTPGCQPPVLEPGGATVVEGDSGTTAIDVPITLSRAIGTPVTVDWATLPGQAGPSDFVGASGTLTFAPGETQKTARVQVNGDTIVESDETLLVSFRNPTNARLSGFYRLGYGIITDDDAGVLIRPGVATVDEPDLGNTTIQVPVALSQSSASPVSVAWSANPLSATSPADFVAASGTLTFAPGETSKSVPVVVKGDEIDEPEEIFVLALSNPVNATVGGWFGLGFGIITDNDL